MSDKSLYGDYTFDQPVEKTEKQVDPQKKTSPKRGGQQNSKGKPNNKANNQEKDNKVKSGNVSDDNAKNNKKGRHSGSNPAPTSNPNPDEKTEQKFRRTNKIVHSEVIMKTSETDPGESQDRKTHEAFQFDARQAKKQRMEYIAATTEMSLEFMDIQKELALKTIITADVIGVERAYLDPDSKKHDICCVAFYKNMKVYIPYDRMFCDPPLVWSAKETQLDYDKRQSMLLTNLIGASVHFVLTKIVLDENKTPAYCIADRKTAMLREQGRFYKRNADYARPRIAEGDVCEADIIAVGHHGVRVNLGGVDCQIPLHLLTYRWLESCHSYYEPGQKLKVKVHSISSRKDGGDGLFVQVNPKAVERDEMIKKNMDKIQVGSTYAARITVIKTQNGQPQVYLFLESLGLPVIARSHWTSRNKRILQPGWLVAYTVDYINNTTNQIYGTIRKVISESPADPNN